MAASIKSWTVRFKQQIVGGYVNGTMEGTTTGNKEKVWEKTYGNDEETNLVRCNSCTIQRRGDGNNVNDLANIIFKYDTDIVAIIPFGDAYNSPKEQYAVAVWGNTMESLITDGV